MTDFSNWDILRNLLMAVRWTVVLSLVAFAGGAVIGLLVLLMRISRRAPARRAAWAFIEVFQGTPLLMQLFLAFFGLALFGVEIPAWLAAGLALSLWSGAYLAEIWRGCVEAMRPSPRASGRPPAASRWGTCSRCAT
ncbi:amino acid ABC transporter permease [Cupriavidus basilensis OR16]|uniref:Amino acid ABC transporter permease n=1 Tax=Cupriavidus basilensis OR16 TaxID=1127483 RepID=H1RZH2_9BURK|nr:amino acid ABC transporter permease [Cupriavidus basilensis OR16]